ncbi:unnamed protein product [Lathyrus sativus]|nr:unnamed protein product [Lathyrus sativus]
MEVEKEIVIARPNWVELPRDLTENILHRLETIELLTSACHVCTSWWNICKDPHMWRTISMTHYCISRISEDNLEMFCRNAIERSCGQLESIDIEHFATDDLLAYIADSSGHLRHMRISMCGMLSDKGFIESIKKLPYLESLDISFDYLSKDSLKAVGRYCPLLQTLICNTTDFDNGVLFASGETMPGLLHLKMFGVMPTEDGLFAILNGCPVLESLDLEECFYVSFEYRKSLEKMCREKIKEFRPPLQFSCDNDSYGDSESFYSSLFSFEGFVSIFSKICRENSDGES